MSSTYGENLKLSIFGQSHGPAVGMTLDGIPAGLPVDLDALQAFLNRRAPGQNGWSTPRKEADKPEFLGGIFDGYTCGAPIAAVIYNQNTRSSDYSPLLQTPRPGHADYTAHVKYGGFQDSAGGGHFSGRLTAPLCIAGGLCKQWLETCGITINAVVSQIGHIKTDPHFDTVCINGFPVSDPVAAKEMTELIEKTRAAGDSLGGVIDCRILGLPAGIGEPMFGGVESKIAQIVYGIPAVKGVEFGGGFRVAEYSGSQCNGTISAKNGNISIENDGNGGINGGITNGMPVSFRVAIKPTPSISLPQNTVDLQTMGSTTIEIKGRHDPCIVPRAVPVVEAAAAIAIYDLILGNTQANRKKEE